METVSNNIYQIESLWALFQLNYLLF
jgi:hypothetical protein